MSESTESSTARIANLHTDMKKIFEGLGTEISKLRKDENETIAKIEKEVDERAVQIQKNYLYKLDYIGRRHEEELARKDLEIRRLRQDLEKLQNLWKESIDETMSKLAGSKKMLHSSYVVQVKDSESECDSESDTESEGEMLSIPQTSVRKSGRPLTRRKQINQQGPRKVAQRKAKFGQEQSTKKTIKKR